MLTLSVAACSNGQRNGGTSSTATTTSVIDRCDAHTLVGWCSLVCYGACRGDTGFAPATVRYHSLLPLDSGEGVERVVDARAGRGPCVVSDDGFVWYAPSSAIFPPLLARYARCSDSAARLVAVSFPPLPRWSRPLGATQALFVAGTLQDDLSERGTAEMAALARAHGMPLTWMLGNRRQLDRNRGVYDTGHRTGGDDLQIEPYDDLFAATRHAFGWYSLVATIDGAGHERDIAHDLRMGARAFWGIAWGSTGIDGTADAGTPWGAYCADVASYKRPAAAGCRLLGLEWTARDLTRAYFSGHEEAYSTDPDDMQQRAALTPADAAAYARQLVDAYAAAGRRTPLVMMAQQEAAGAGADPMGTWRILSASYDEARRDGMQRVTMSNAVAHARAFAGKRRAVAFPYIPGLPDVYQGAPGVGAQPYPATIDYVDRDVGMTFAAGATLPVRVFPYALALTSAWDRPLPQLPRGEFATLTAAAADGHELVLRFDAPLAQRFGVALWTDPDRVGWQSPNVVRAGRAGAVAVFDLPQGVADVVLRCRRCPSLEFPLAQ